MPSQYFYEFPDLIWKRKVMILAFWVPIASFVTAVFIVTLSFYIFDPYHGDGRDPFIKEIKRAQEINKPTY